MILGERKIDETLARPCEIGTSARRSAGILLSQESMCVGGGGDGSVARITGLMQAGVEIYPMAMFPTLSVGDPEGRGVRGE